MLYRKRTLVSRRFVVVFALLLGGAFGCFKAQDRRQFDLPAGRADLTLMQFAKQAEVEIVYDAKAVEGAQTNAVSGSYSPGDALRIMLNGTGLTVDRDGATGAFAVGRGDFGEGESAPSDHQDSGSTEIINIGSGVCIGMSHQEFASS